MSLHLHSSTQIGGILVRDLKSFLKDAGRISRDDFEDPLRAPFLRTCLSNSLVQEYPKHRIDYEITDLGRAIRSASFTPRRPLSEARLIFDRLCENMEKIEAERILKIPSFWLYGSLMRQERMIGDIDLVLDFERQVTTPEVMVRRVYERLEERDGTAFRGSKYEAVASYIGGILDDSLPVGFLSFQIDDFELRMIGCSCERWSKVSGSFQGEGALPCHPTADLASKPQILEIMTDRGMYRSGIPSDDVLDAAIRESLDRLRSGTLTPESFSGLFRDMEMRYGWDEPGPAIWDAMKGYLAWERDCVLPVFPEDIISLCQDDTSPDPG